MKKVQTMTSIGHAPRLFPRKTTIWIHHSIGQVTFVQFLVMASRAITIAQIRFGIVAQVEKRLAFQTQTNPSIGQVFLTRFLETVSRKAELQMNHQMIGLAHPRFLGFLMTQKMSSIGLETFVQFHEMANLVKTMPLN
jgi:hypothetical protein